ncbi:MAG: hypothetical protein QM756_36635 [Polyangiaceae bacterium]
MKSRTLCPDSVYNDGDCECTYAKERADRLKLPAPPCGSKEVGKPQPNPLFSNLSGAPAFDRDGSQVFLAGIVGVPWQDLATADTLHDPARLEYLTAPELALYDQALGMTRWDLILGDPITYGAPRDPFMQEASWPRTGQNPVTGDPIVGTESIDPRANAINGHERDTQRSGLQYACTFQLRTPRVCPPNSRCDCADDIESRSDSVCQPPGGGVGSNTQYFAKAYPGLRELDVLRRHGDNAVVASICPKVLSGAEEDFGFGYRPALSGLIKRIHCTTLDGRFEQDPSSASFGSVDCRLVAVRQVNAACSCESAGGSRRALSADDAATLRSELVARGVCGGTTSVDCNSLCACEIPQATGSALKACQFDEAMVPLDSETSLPADGWCYVAPEQGFGAAALVNQCPAGKRQNLRQLGGAQSRPDEHLFAICGAPCPADKQ